MLGKKSMLIVLLSSILLATNTPSVNANIVYKEGTKEENQLILNYNKQINNQSKYIKYLNSLNQSLKEETIEWHKGLERERLEKIKQIEEQNKNDIESSNISNSISEEKINFICSFYSGSDEENGGQTLTASGQSLREGIVASNNFKFGTRIHIDKLGEYQVEDTGNPNFIKQIDENTYKIDVYVNSSEEAERLGVIKSTGYIIK